MGRRAPSRPMFSHPRHVREDEDARHDSVRRTIETLATRGVISLPQIEEVKVQQGAFASDTPNPLKGTGF